MELDAKKLDTAIIYLQRIADGKNPINNTPAEDDSVLNNPNVVRCMYFVKEILEEVKQNGIGTKKRLDKKERRKGRAVGMFPREALKSFKYRGDTSITHIISQLYESVNDKTIKKINGKDVNDWLVECGYLCMVYNQETNSMIKVPSEKGALIGLRSERLVLKEKICYSVYYDKNAQEFLIANFEKFLCGEIIS